VKLQAEHKYGLLEKLLFPRTRLNQARLKSELRNKTVLITGASYGIGKYTAILLGQTTAKLILVARTSVELEKLKNHINRSGGNAETFTADLRSESDMEQLITFLNKIESLDVFINNAGKSIRRPLVKSLNRFHDFKRTMDINYFAPVKLILSLTKNLKENQGHIINVSAINVLMAPTPSWAAYQASKSAFDQCFKCFHSELEALNINTTSIYLPLVKTRMIEPTEAYKNMPAMSPEHVAKLIGKAIITKRRVYKPWWSFLGEIGSVLFTKSWMRYHRKNQRDKNPSQFI